MEGSALDTRDALIEALTRELPVLRARMRKSQDEMSKLMGVSRATYNTIETGKRRMNWGTFLSVLTVCAAFKDADRMLAQSGISRATEELLRRE